MTILFPILGKGPFAREAAFQESRNRQWQQTKDDATSQWFKVVDTETGKIIAAGMWHTYETDPFNEFPDELSEKEANEETAYAQVVRICTRGCTMRWLNMLSNHQRRCINTYLIQVPILERCLAHPNYRDQGAAGLIVKQGVDRADELDLEAFVEATESGAHLYEKHGFVASDSFGLGTEREGTSEEWQRLLREQLIGYTFLWRPKQGKWISGEMKFPWEA